MSCKLTPHAYAGMVNGEEKEEDGAASRETFSLGPA